MAFQVMQPIENVIKFVLTIDRLKGVMRKTRPIGLSRYENSAEHSWQLALFAFAIVSHTSYDINVDRVIRMLLIHDLGEIETGDTIVYAEGGWEQRKAEELAAIERIVVHLAEEQRNEIVALWKEFECGDSPEARLANAVDRAMPVILNLNNNGQSWRENNVSFEQVLERNKAPISNGCPELWHILEVLLIQARNQGLFDGERSS